jgi:hypothetical protein|uniref:SnoaL-like domain-containing protein n=1 Tax=Attheya septentrionalis TaxID=420275 RepID=A0A7S2XT65_9STRA|mmetsp:Transcript_27109/g.49324  ORF Transcript_27109/g.49324 Transcript_27109/m.49324 type:complete len:312 (+) Transcript_27109:151-1086(+)
MKIFLSLFLTTVVSVSSTNVLETYHAFMDTMSQGVVDIKGAPWELLADNFVSSVGTSTKEEYYSWTKSTAGFFHHDYLLGREWLEDDGATGYMFLHKYIKAPNADGSQVCHFHDLCLQKVTANEQGQLASYELFQDMSDLLACITSTKEAPVVPKKKLIATERLPKTLEVYHAFQDSHFLGDTLDEETFAKIPYDLMAEDVVTTSGSGPSAFLTEGRDNYKNVLHSMMMDGGALIHYDYLSEWVDPANEKMAYLFISVYAVVNGCHHHDFALHKVTVNDEGQIQTLEMIQNAAPWFACLAIVTENNLTDEL